MRNFYDQPTNKIFNRMFGKQARQIQADPTLDITKCKCCNCDKVECKGCIEGHFVTTPPGLEIFDPQDNIDKGILKSGGCCHGPNNGLIFEYERPGDVNYGPECCPDPNAPVGEPQGYQKCCGIREIGASNVRFYYNYIGKYFKMDYAAAGKQTTAWPGNGRPRLCSLCNPASTDVARPNTWPGGRETCLDYMPVIQGGGPIDDQVQIADAPCSTIGPQWSGCQCMGKDLLKDTNRTSKRLSYYRKREMERLPYYRWLADIMCYDEGNVVANPHYKYIEGETVAVLSNGTLYEHLLAVVHCEHWYELALCPQNPEHSDGENLGDGMTNSAGEPINVNTSILAPRFWVYACSGVPFFDFELEDALDKGYIDDAQYQEIKIAFSEGRTPSQQIMGSLAKGGYFDTADWRLEAFSEIQNLKGNTFTSDFYGGTFDFCSNLNYLGPVRKRYWQDDIGVPGISGPGRLDPKKARPNAISPPRGTIIEPVINSLEDATLKNIQLPNSFLRDPWKERNKPYPKEPIGPNEPREEWEAFVLWRDSQWVYMHARPGGWDYVCSGYQDPNNPDSTLQIPDLPRRFSNLPNTLGAGCLDGILGIPVSEMEVDGGCSDIQCGSVDPATGQFIEYRKIGCGDIAPSCIAQACNPGAESYCASHPERGGGNSFCRNVSMAADCNGIRFNYTTYKPVIRTIEITPCDEPPCYENATFHTCDRTRNAYLYRVNITKGNYDSFCPFTCRSLEIPKQLERAIPVLSSNKIAYQTACRNRQQGYPVNFCPGYYCFSPENDQGIYPGTYGGQISAFPFNPQCCSKTGTGKVSTPLPSDPTHRASNKSECK